MTQQQLSADGRWRWDGKQWVPAVIDMTRYVAPPPAGYVAAPPTNSLAIVSLAAGILSWFLCPLVGGVVAVITGHIARGQIRRSGEAGDGLALVGLILGYAHLVVAALVALTYVLVFGLWAVTAIFSGSHQP